MQSSKTTGAGTTETASKRTSAPGTSTETFLPRGLANTSNGVGANKGTNGRSRGEADSYYGVSSDHPLTSSYLPPNGSIDDASLYCGTGAGGGGGGGGVVSGNYNPTLPSAYSGTGTSHTTNTIGTGAIPITTLPTSTSSYNPTPVPQVSPYYPGTLPTNVLAASAPLDISTSLATSTPLAATHGPQGEAALYYSAPQAETSVASTYGSTTHQQQNHSGLSHSLEASVTGVISAVQGHNHSHSHNSNNPPPPLRQSIRKLWENLRAEERYAIGQFELYSEIIGVCRGCFEPGSSYTEAPRTHHYGQRWTSRGWRVKRKSTKRVWMRLFKSRNTSGFTSPSDRSSGSDSTSSLSDSDLSDNTRKRRRLEKQIRREKGELKRREREELREREGYARPSSGLRRNSSDFSSTQWKGISGSGSNGESGHHYTKDSTAYWAPGMLRGGDLQKSKEQQPFYNPGYGPDGQAHPTYYTGPILYGDKQLSKPSGSILGRWFGLSSSDRKEIKSKDRHSTSTPLPGELFQLSSKSSSATASDDGLTSPSSLGSKQKSWFSRPVKKGKKSGEGEKVAGRKEKKIKKGKGKSSPSLSLSSSSNSRLSFSSSSGDGLIYGGVYSSRKGTSLDSASIKSKLSYTGSVAKSFQSASSRVSGTFGIGKTQRRKSWKDYYGTPGSVSHPGSAAVGVGLNQRYSTSDSRSSQSRAATASASVGNGHTESYVISTEGGATQHSSEFSGAIKSYSSTDMTSSTFKRNGGDIYMRRQNSESSMFSLLSGEDKRLKRREIGIQYSGQRERSRDRSSIMTGKSQRRASSVESWESLDSSRKSRSQHQKISTTQKTNQKSRSGFLSGLFSGTSVGFRERSRSCSKGSMQRVKKMDELKRSEVSKKSKDEPLADRSGRIFKEDASTSTSYEADARGEEASARLQKVYPMATDNPSIFDITKSTPLTSVSRQQSEASFVQSSYASEKLHSEREHQSSKTTITATAGGKIEGANVAVGGFPSLVGSVDQQRRPLPVPIQPVISAQSAITPITSTTTIINNHNITHHTTSSSVINNSSSSSVSNLAQRVVVSPPLPSVAQSQSSTVEASAMLIQEVAAAAASAAAVQVAGIYAKDQAERSESDKRERQSERESQERIQKELRELRIREEKAAFEQKEKSEREEKERRALRIAIEQKEKEEAELRAKQEREERAAIALKQKMEWEATERAKDEAARLARIKQDEEHALQIRSDEERKYREWSRLQALQRQEREQKSDELFQRIRNEEEEKARQVALQTDVGIVGGIETERRVRLEDEVRSRKLEEEANNARLFGVNKGREVESKNIHELEGGKRIQQKINEKHLQDSIGIPRAEFLEEQERLGHQAKILEQGRRNQFNVEVHSSKRETQIIEAEEAEIIQKHKGVIERLSTTLEQIASEAYEAKDESRAREVQRQVQVEKEKENRLRIEDIKVRQRDGEVQHLDAQIQSREENGAEPRTEEENKVLPHMDKTRQKYEKTGEFVAQVEAEKENETRVQIEQETTDQVKHELRERRRELVMQIAAEERRAILRKEDEETGRVESRRERQQRIVDTKVREGVRVGTVTGEQAVREQPEEGWRDMTEEDRIIHAEVQRRLELERKEKELKKQAADLQHQLEEVAAKKEARRQRRRADPGYKEREIKRSRERSRVRESEIEKARREEVKFVREKTGLDKVEKKKRYNAADPLPTQDIPGFIEGLWDVIGGVPVLLQTPPTPPPGTPKYPQVLHCKGSDFPRMAGGLSRDIVPAPDIFMVQPVSSETRQGPPVEFERRVEGSTMPFGRVETSFEFEQRMAKMSSQSSESVEAMRSVRQEAVGVPSIATGKPFTGTPVAPVPTVAPGYNIGAAVIGYRQEEDLKGYDQIGSQQKRQLQRSDQGQGLVYFGPELPPDLGFSGPVRGADTARTADVYYGSELPENFVSASSSVVYQASTRTDSRSQSSFERTSSDLNAQPNSSEVAYGPVLHPTLKSQRSVYDAAAAVSSERQSESSYERASSTYSHGQNASTFVAGPVSPAVQTPHQSTDDKGTQSFRIPGAFDGHVYVDAIEDSSRESRTASAPAVPIYSSVPASEKPFASASSKVTHSSGSVTRSSSAFTREVNAGVREVSREYQSPFTPAYHPPFASEKHSLSESSATLSTVHSVAESSTISKNQDFWARPAGVTYENTSMQGSPMKQPNVFAFQDQEATSRGATPISGSLKNVEEDSGALTREQKDEDNEFMAIAAASAEQAGFDVGLVLGSGTAPKSGSISGGKDATLSVSPSSIVRARSPFMEEVDDEDAPHIKRQLGQHELPVEVYWSQEESEARKSQSRVESRSRTDSHSAQSIAHSSRPLRSDHAYQVSTPKALEWVPARVPSSQPATSPVISSSNVSSTSHSKPPTESVVQERKDHAHIVERSVSPPRSASLSSSYRLRMGPVKEESGVERPGASRSSSLSRIFRSRKDSNKEVSDIEQTLRSEKVRRGREQSPKGNNDELRTSRRRSEIGGSHGRTQFGDQREEFGEPRRSLERRATEQWSTERQSRDRQPPERRATEQWLTERQEQSNERHSRRSMESVYQSQEVNAREQGGDIKVDETTNSGAEASAQDKSSNTPKVSTWGKVFAWGSRSKDETKSGASTVGAGLGRALTQARPDLVNSPPHRRSVSEASGQRQRPAELTRNNTEEWEQVTVTPPQKSRTSSLREVDIYERVDNDNMSTHSAPVALRDGSGPYPSEDKEGFKRTFDTNLPQHVEAQIASFTALEAGSPEKSASEAEEQKAGGGDRKPRSLTGFLRAARRLGAGQKGSQTPPRGAEEKPVEMPAASAELSRIDTDISEFNTSASEAILRQEALLEQLDQVEETLDHSSQRNMKQQAIAEHVPFPIPAADAELRKETRTFSRLPLPRARSSKSLRKEVEVARESQELHVGRGGGEMETDKSWGQISPEKVESSHQAGVEFGSHEGEYTRSGHSLQRRATDHLLEEQSLDRRPLQRRSTEHGSTERQPQDKQPLLRRSTEHWSTEGQSLPGQSAIGTTGGNEGQERFEKSSEVRKGQSIDRKVKHSADPQTCDGEQVAKTFNYVEKPASALMLTLSEGVDLSSDVKRKQGDTQSSEPPDIFDNRDSPPSYGNFPLESPKSLIYSPTEQQEFIPDTFSFVSRTPSPVLPPAAVNIYEYPATPQRDSSSVYNLQSISLASQDTSFEKVPVLHKEISSLPPSYLSTLIPVEAPGISTESSPIISPQESEYSIIPAEDLLPAGVAPRMPNNHSLSLTNDTPTSPIIGASQLPSLHQSNLSINVFSRTSEDLPPLLEADSPTSIDHVQELSHVPGIDSSPPRVDLALPEGLFSIPEEASSSPTSETQQAPSSPLNEVLAYIPLDISGNSFPLSGTGKSSLITETSSTTTHVFSASSENHSFSFRNSPSPSIAEAPIPSTTLSEAISVCHEPEDIPYIETRPPLSPIFEDQESVEETPVQENSPSPADTPAGDVSVLQLSVVQLPQSPAENQFTEKPLVPWEKQLQSQSRGPLLEHHSTLPENFIGSFQHPIHQGVSLFATPNELYSFPSSEPQVTSYSEPKPSLSLSPQSPWLPESIPECPHPASYQPSSPHILPVEPEISQPELPHLDTAFSHHDAEVLPGPPLSGPSSPVVLASVLDILPLYALNDPISLTVVPEVSSRSQPASIPTSPVVVFKQGLNLSTEFSSSELSSSPIKLAEPMNPDIEIPPLFSQSSSPQLPPSEFGSTLDLLETSTQLPEFSHNRVVSSSSAIDELMQTAHSSPPLIAAKDKSLTDAPKSSSSRLALVLDDLPQLPSSDPSSPYDLLEGPFRFPELPPRDHASLSPILEELPDSPSVAARDGSVEVLPMSTLPMSTPASPSISVTIQNDIPELPQREPLSPVRELALDQSSEPGFCEVQYEPSTATSPTPPIMEITISDGALEISQSERPSVSLADQSQQPPDPAGELEAAHPIGSPSRSLSVTVSNDLSEMPQGESLLPVEDQYFAAGHHILLVADPGKTAVEALLSTDVGVQFDQPSENYSPRADAELALGVAPALPVSLPPIIYPKNESTISELENLVLDEIPASSHVTTMEPAIVDIPETDKGLPVRDSEYGIESGSFSRRASTDVVQLPSVPEVAKGYLLGMGNLPLSEGLSVAPSAVSAEPTVDRVSGVVPEPTINTSSLEKTSLVGSEFGSITRHFSIEGIRLPSLLTGSMGSVSVLESLRSPETNLTLLSPETLAVEMIEADEHPSPPTPVSMPRISVEPITKGLVAELPTQGEENLLQGSIYQLSQLEVKPIVLNMELDHNKNLESPGSMGVNLNRRMEEEAETLRNERENEEKEGRKWGIESSQQVIDLGEPTASFPEISVDDKMSILPVVREQLLANRTFEQEISLDAKHSTLEPTGPTGEEEEIDTHEGVNLESPISNRDVPVEKEFVAEQVGKTGAQGERNALETPITHGGSVSKREEGKRSEDAELENQESAQENPKALILPFATPINEHSVDQVEFLTSVSRSSTQLPVETQTEPEGVTLGTEPLPVTEEDDSQEGVTLKLLVTPEESLDDGHIVSKESGNKIREAAGRENIEKSALVELERVLATSAPENLAHSAGQTEAIPHSAEMIDIFNTKVEMEEMVTSKSESQQDVRSEEGKIGHMDVLSELSVPAEGDLLGDEDEYFPKDRGERSEHEEIQELVPTEQGPLEVPAFPSLGNVIGQLEIEPDISNGKDLKPEPKDIPSEQTEHEQFQANSSVSPVAPPSSSIIEQPVGQLVDPSPPPQVITDYVKAATSESESQQYSPGENVKQEELQQINTEQPESSAAAADSSTFEKIAEFPSPIVESINPPGEPQDMSKIEPEPLQNVPGKERPRDKLERKSEYLSWQMEDRVYPPEALDEIGPVGYPISVPKRSHKSPVSDSIDLERDGIDVEVLQPTIEAQEEVAITSGADAGTMIAPSKAKELAFPLRSSTPQIELSAIEHNNLISHESITEQAERGDMEEFPLSIALPESPLSLPHEPKEYTLSQEPQPTTPVSTFEDVQEYLTFPSGRSTPDLIPAKLKEKTKDSRPADKAISQTINPNQENVDKLTASLAYFEDQVPDQSTGPETTHTAVEGLCLQNLPNTPTELPISVEGPGIFKSTITPLSSAIGKAKEIAGKMVPPHESTPMLTSLSGGPKKKSKKARQREARKRKSLQGIDTSGHSAVAAEAIPALDSAEAPPGVPVTVEPFVQLCPVLSPVAASHANETTASANKGMTAEVKPIGGIEGSEHAQPSGSMNENLAQEVFLPATPEAGSLEDVKTIAEDNHEPLVMSNPMMVEPSASNGENYQGAKFLALSSPSPEIAVEDPSTDQHSTLRDVQGLSLGLHGQTEAKSALVEHGSEVGENLPEPAVTAPFSPAGLFLPSPTMESLKDSASNAQRNPPEFAADNPAEPATLKFPLSRSNRKVDVEHLHLPSSISQNPLTGEDLPSLSDLATGSEYSGGVSLQLGPDTPLPNHTNMSQPASDPEDDDPSLLSFGGGTVQPITVAQVGLRAPMFPSSSKSKNFLGATDSPTPRYFSRHGGSVDIDEFDESAYDPTVSEGDGRHHSTPSIEVDTPAEDGGSKGEEGIEHEGDHGSHNNTVTTAIENEATQSDEKPTSELPLLAIQSPVSSEEAAPVPKEKIIHPYNTENAEDPPSQTTNNRATQPLSLDPKPSSPFATTTHPTLLVKPTTQSHNRSPTATQLQPLLISPVGKKREVKNTYAPPSETPTTPPPLTHSSSFESAIEFWKRRISIPATTDIIPSPELSPYTTNSDVGVPLPISIPPKSRKSSVQPVGQLLDREIKVSSSNPATTAEASARTTIAPPTQVKAGTGDLQSLPGQDPKPPIADPSYQVSDGKQPQQNPIADSSDRAFRKESLKTQNSYDSLQTIITCSDRAPSSVIPDTREHAEKNLTSEGVSKTKNSETFNKSYESLFGEPPREQATPDPLANKPNFPVNTQSNFQLSEKKLDSAFPYPDKFLTKSLGETNHLIPPTNPTNLTKPGLPTTTERKFEDGTKAKPSQSASVTEQSFISAEDLLARLAVQPVRKLTPIPDQSIVNPKVRLLSDKKMDFLKRGERRRPAPPSLRRAGSQIESPYASSEHIIFGGETPVRGKEVIKKADIYEAWGDRVGEPKSPTRPPSIRRRQSMQIVDLENRLEGLAAENTNLTQKKANIEKALGESLQRHKNDAVTFSHELETQKVLLTEKDSEITELKKKLDYYREEVARLSQTNDSLAATNTSLSVSYKFSYAALASKYERKREQLANLSKENSDLQASFSKVKATMENVIQTRLQEKTSELDRLREELDKAREEVRKLQQHVSTRQDNKYIDTKDLHHFSSSCQQLFSSLKIWCNQFSSFSVGTKCVHVHRIVDEAARDRVEDVMLDDRGARKMLKDEKRRPEVFMAITMRMIWEHVFTRYLFGLDVDERQKLLSLERTLAENGEHEAVHQWRATTLTLLSNRPTFGAKRITDSEEIVATILNLLNYLLPPPSQYTNLALESLRNVVQHAVQLATEMRTQRAEYVMKRPPRPEYDDNGEVINSVSFKASIMQNRGTEPASDRELEAEGVTVKMVLFPQVIRRGNEYGENYDTEITVLPMQVLVNRPQLRSESRASNKSIGSAWRDEQQRAGVSRLTPITDQSPRETPRTTPEKARITSQSMLPMIPEQTIRMVPEEILARAYPSPSAEKKRKIDNQ